MEGVGGLQRLWFEICGWYAKCECEDGGDGENFRRTLLMDCIFLARIFQERGHFDRKLIDVEVANTCKHYAQPL